MSQEGLIQKGNEKPSYAKPLNEDEIKLANLLIEEAHELMDTPLGKVLPVLAPCSSGKKEKADPLLP
jgi:hypothetical protein